MEMKKGCDFDVFAVVTNNTSVEKKCRLVFASRAMSYDGSIGKECGFKDLLNVELPPGGGVCVQVYGIKIKFQIKFKTPNIVKNKKNKTCFDTKYETIKCK